MVFGRRQSASSRRSADVTTLSCEHGIVCYVQTESDIDEMGFKHVLVSTEFACQDCDVSVLLDQQFQVE